MLKTRVTCSTSAATLGLLVTALSIAMVSSSPLWTETMTSGVAAVQRNTKEAGGSMGMGNYLNVNIFPCLYLIINF